MKLKLCYVKHFYKLAARHCMFIPYLALKIKYSAKKLNLHVNILIQTPIPLQLYVSFYRLCKL